MNSILTYVPEGFELRAIQRDILLDVEAAWPTHDVIAIRADVGVGKSLVLQTVAAWAAAQGSTSAIITPRVALQEQYLSSFPKSPVLKGASRYKCKKKGISNCAECKLVEDEYCESGCPYKSARDKVKAHRYAVFNLQSYVHARDPRDIIMVDEAHTLFDQLSEANSINLWQHKYGYPTDINNFETILIWMEKVRDQLNDRESELTRLIMESRAKGDTCTEHIIEREEVYNLRDRLFRIYRSARNKDSNLFIEQTEEFFRGKKRPLLKIRPKTLEGINTILKAAKTKKIILASATLEKVDLDKLGIGDKRVTILSYGSPFDPADQPIIIDPVGNMGFKYKDKNMPALARRIQELRERHKDTKGLVHMPYNMAVDLQKLLKDDWAMWHTSEDKEKKLNAFKAAPAGTVFIVSGMGMGIDMAGPEYGWQAIAKIMYPSRADKLIDYWYSNDQAWITWLATRELIQACGRINRYLGDKGVTYILDSCIGNPNKRLMGLWQNANRLGYLHSHFKKRVTWL